ncbi:hypothetical protein H072_1827 [Dactylellina haptotyla CBS 200.50]|uniref:F-box domain-containing protein n=1 Tax=Dactylellina haptotyla (strain CBS 200.50) TaxID=1284197 RepID=S8AMS7_DACHA|nr:hypothetical protein H072_1827 [Dactylellina haptotyla CBS 200.50]
MDDLPVEIHLQILSYLDLDDQIFASDVCSLWRTLIRQDKGLVQNRYLRCINDSRLPGTQTHKLLCAGQEFRLSCTVRNGLVECYRLLFTTDDISPNAYDDTVWPTRDISGSEFLDELAFPASFTDSDGEIPRKIQRALCLYYPSRYPSYQWATQVFWANFLGRTVREMVEEYVEKSKQEMEDGGISIDLLQEIIFSYVDISDINSQPPVEVGSLVGMAIKRPTEKYRSWVRRDRCLVMSKQTCNRVSKRCKLHADKASTASASPAQSLEELGGMTATPNSISTI